MKPQVVNRVRFNVTASRHCKLRGYDYLSSIRASDLLRIAGVVATAVFILGCNSIQNPAPVVPYATDTPPIAATQALPTKELPTQAVPLSPTSTSTPRPSETPPQIPKVESSALSRGPSQFRNLELAQAGGNGSGINSDAFAAMNSGTACVVLFRDRDRLQPLDELITQDGVLRATSINREFLAQVFSLGAPNKGGVSTGVWNGNQVMEIQPYLYELTTAEGEKSYYLALDPIRDDHVARYSVLCQEGEGVTAQLWRGTVFSDHKIADPLEPAFLTRAQMAEKLGFPGDPAQTKSVRLERFLDNGELTGRMSIIDNQGIRTALHFIGDLKTEIIMPLPSPGTTVLPRPTSTNSAPAVAPTPHIELPNLSTCLPIITRDPRNPDEVIIPNDDLSLAPRFTFGNFLHWRDKSAAYDYSRNFGPAVTHDQWSDMYGGIVVGYDNGSILLQQLDGGQPTGTILKIFVGNATFEAIDPNSYANGRYTWSQATHNGCLGDILVKSPNGGGVAVVIRVPRGSDLSNLAATKVSFKQ